MPNNLGTPDRFQLSDIDREAFQRVRQLRITGRKWTLTRDLPFMAQYKYDSYEVYGPVKRFLPSLLEWLTQFQKPSEKEAALHMIRCLLFLSRREILELSHVVYQKILHELLEEIIRLRSLNPFDYPTAYKGLKQFLRTKCVFVGMSDGAQIDYLRRLGTGMIENDQVVPYYKLDKGEIRKLSHCEYAFLIDDMCLSGTTFLGEGHAGRYGSPAIGGQIARFIRTWSEVRFKSMYYCPYVVTGKALKRLEQTLAAPDITRTLSSRGTSLKILQGMIIPESYSILSRDDENGGIFKEDIRRRVAKLCRTYYDYRVENPATRKGGGTMFGFDRVGILLVRYNNTPNDTPSLIWNPLPDRKALFRRLVRHYK